MNGRESESDSDRWEIQYWAEDTLTRTYIIMIAGEYPTHVATFALQASFSSRQSLQRLVLFSATCVSARREVGDHSE